MAVRYRFDRSEKAGRLECAVEKVLSDGLRTGDLLNVAGATAASTAQMGDAIVAALDESL